MKWTTPDALTEQVVELWNRGDILRARVTGEELFPLELRLKRPSARDVRERFGEVQDWARALSGECREARGFGYELRLETLRNRVQGANDLPVAAIVPDENDALRLIRRQTDADRFMSILNMTLAKYPGLRDWLSRRSILALGHFGDWSRILAVLAWFSANPRSGLYLRQLDIPGVDTKFIEGHRGLLAELLDIVLPENALDRSASGVKGFAQRYGLRSEPPLLRFRILDANALLQGLSDISLTPAEFSTLKLPIRRVFVTENRTNGLAFPDHPGAIVVFGMGYGMERFVETPWLKELDVRYWGDIDTHGFRILDRLRATLPQARSFLMDRATLEAHRSLCVEEPAEKRYTCELFRLSSEEHTLFENLRHDRIGVRIRLEQERVGYGWLRTALSDLDTF
jgi:hypothetical protein